MATETGKAIIQFPNDKYGTPDQYFHDAVKVLAGEGGGEEELDPEADVRFYDYDGTLLHTYTKDEFLALTEMPGGGAHDGLRFQEWNWSFENARTMVEWCGKLDTGALYTTVGCDARIKIKVEEFAITLYLGFTIQQSDTVNINWGDGSSTIATSSSWKQYSHTFNPGEYSIELSLQNNVGTFTFYGTSSTWQRDGYPANSCILTTESISGSGYDKIKDPAIANIREINFGSHVKLFGPVLAKLSDVVVSMANETASTDSSPIAVATFSNIKYIILSRHVMWSSFQGVMVIFADTYPTTSSSISVGTRNTRVFTPLTPATNKYSMPGSTKELYVSPTAQSLNAGYMYGYYSMKLPLSCSSAYNISIYADFTEVRLPVYEGEVQFSGRALKIIIPEGITSFAPSSYDTNFYISEVDIASTVTSFRTRSSSGGTPYYPRACKKIIFRSMTPPAISDSGSARIIKQDETVVYIPRGSLSAYSTATNYPRPTSTWTYIEYGDAPEPGDDHQVTLTMNTYNVSSASYVAIYDGTDASGTELVRWEGSNIPDAQHPYTNTFTVSSGHIFIDAPAGYIYGITSSESISGDEGFDACTLNVDSDGSVEFTIDFNF